MLPVNDQPTPIGALIRRTRDALDAAHAADETDRATVTREQFEQTAASMPATGRGDYECEACHDDGFVLDAEADGAEFLRPCQACRPDLYERFRAGQLDSDQPTPTSSAPPPDRWFRSHADASQPRERDDEPHRMF